MRQVNEDEGGSFSFGELLKQFRKSKGISQQEIATKLQIHRNTIGKWERGDGLPENKTIVLELARQLQLNPHNTRQLLETSLTAFSPYWYVPYQQNPFFTGREEALQQLYTALNAEQSVVLSQSSALSGLGGIGKTQTAIEYAYRYADEYSAVFWISAETTERILASVVAIADLLNLPEKQDQSRVIVMVTRWLASHKKWLLILDNVEDIELIKDFLPSARCGSLLFTSRRQALGITSHVLNLDPMTPGEGVRFLLRRSRQPGMPISDAASSQGMLLSNSIVSGTVTLVELLEGLPLALDQAGAYIEETGCSVTEYVQRYSNQRKLVLARRGNHGGMHPASVSTTLRLSVEWIERDHPVAVDLLRICAFLHAEGIPEELLRAGAPYVEPELGAMLADPYQFDLALAALRSASLVTRHLETQTLSIHRLVQAVLLDQMEPTHMCQWSKQIICMVNAAFPAGTFETWAQCERSLAQAQACVPLIEQAGNALPEAGELLYKMGSYLLERGRYTEAEPLLEQAVTLGEQQHGSDHLELIPRLMGWGELFWRLGMYERAESLLQRILASGKQHLEPEHPRIAETQHNLATLYLYWNHEKRKQAEALFQQALRIREQHFGSRHPETAVTLNGLATLYCQLGKYEQAEPLYQRALYIHEQQLDAEHPLIAQVLINLASTYREQGKYEQAEPLYQRALHIREQQLGPQHHLLALGFAHLAILYCRQGKYEQAEPLYQRALIICEQQLGTEHLETMLLLQRLTNLYPDQQKYEQIEPLYQRILVICEQELGTEHPKILELRNDHRRFREQRRAVKMRSNEQQEHIQSLQVSINHTSQLSDLSSQGIPTNSPPEINPLQDFLTACCELHPHAWSRASEIWQAYERRVQQQQERFPLSRRAFTTQLKAMGCQADRTNTARIWRGIALISRAHDDM